MQRMKLHVSGVSLPKLGSLQDRVLRDFVFYQDTLDLEKSKLLMMSAMGSSPGTSSDSRRAWGEAVSDIWETIRKKTYFIKITEEEKRAEKLMDFYQNVVKKVNPKLTLGKSGQMQVEGLGLLERIFTKKPKK